jgi:hypothetical protein
MEKLTKTDLLEIKLILELYKEGGKLNPIVLSDDEEEELKTPTPKPKRQKMSVRRVLFEK